MNPIFILVIIYIIAQFAIGALVSRHIQTEEEYLIAGRNLGYTLTTFSLFATWFGAETCIGASGAIYADGLLGGTADPFGYALCISLMGALFAIPIWKLRLTTIADFYRQRYSVSVERVVVLLMIPTSLLWAAAQIRGFGQVLAATSGLNINWTLAFAATIVIAYTVYGGLLADVWTDLVQGIAIIIGLATLLYAIVIQHGIEPFTQINSKQLNLFEVSERGWLTMLESWIVPVIGSVTAAELITRAIAARSPQIAQRSAFMAGGLYLIVGLVPVSIGLIGKSLIPELAEPEQFLPRVAAEYLSPILQAMLIGALVSAILSTVDSTLLVSASLMSHNIVIPLLQQGLTEQQKVTLARSFVVFFGFVAYLLATHSDGISDLVEQASSFGSTGIFVVLIFGLYTPFGSTLSALTALIAGAITWCIGAYWLEIAHPYLISLCFATLAYLAGLAVQTSNHE